MKKIIIYLLFAFISLNTLIAQSKEQVSLNFENILDNLKDATIENTLLLPASSEAYIGKIYPAIPPHFQAGLSTSAVLIDTSALAEGVQNMLSFMKTSLESVNGTVDLNFSIPQTLPLPTLALKGRIGGFFLPFDIGLFAIGKPEGMLNSLSFSDFSFGFDYMCFGADFRYAVLEGNLLLPQISLGFGYIFHKQSLNLQAAKDLKFNNEDITGGKLNQEIDLSLKTNTFYLQAQISKQILFLTGFLGFRGDITVSNYDYSWNFETKINDTVQESASANDQKSLSSGFDFANFKPQIFGGVGFTFGFFDLSINAQYNFVNNLFSFALSTCFSM